MYRNIDQGHFLDNISSSEHTLTLDDGSRWQVYEGYMDMLADWQPSHMIRVKQNKDPDYPYKIINIHTNESIEAILLQE
jgi:hypothetical protein